MNETTEYIIVYGPAGSGKSINAAALKEHFKCDHVFDDWYDLGTKLSGVTGRVLILSQKVEVRGHHKNRKLLEGVEWYSVDQVRVLLGDRWIAPMEGFSQAREHAKMLERAGVKTAHALGRELLAGPDLPIWHFDPSRAGLDGELDMSLSLPRVEKNDSRDGLDAAEIEDLAEDGCYMGEFLTIIGDQDEEGEGSTRERAATGSRFVDPERVLGQAESWMESVEGVDEEDRTEEESYALALWDEMRRLRRESRTLQREVDRDEAEDIAAEREALRERGPNSVQAAAAERDEAAGRTMPGVD